MNEPHVLIGNVIYDRLHEGYMASPAMTPSVHVRVLEVILQNEYRVFPHELFDHTRGHRRVRGGKGRFRG